MTELKARDVAGFVRKPDLDNTVILIYGPDKGLVSEFAETIAEKTGVPADDPFCTIRMHADSGVAGDALLNEAYTVAMFAGKRLLRITNATNDKDFVRQVTRILEDPPQDAWVLIEGGELKKGSALRSLVEKSKTGITVPCYSDGVAAIHTLIDETFPPSEGRLDRDVRQYLGNHMGADRSVTRRELEKVALLAADGEPVTLDDVMALVGDASTADMNSVIDAVISGQIDKFDEGFLKLQSAGQNVNALFFAAMRQFQQLDHMRAEMDRERKSASAVVASARPPVFFARRKMVEQALQIWTAPAIRHAIQRLQDTVLKARSLRGLDYATTHICLLGLTIAARRRA